MLCKPRSVNIEFRAARIVIFNAGAVHRVGPNRMTVTLARRLAAMGLPSLRFDLEGLGDSVLREPGRENHPYPATAVADVVGGWEAIGRFVARA